MIKFRIGNGYDVHAFEDSKPLILGGVTIHYHKGMKAHSDGDVLIHAVCDALLGAAALGDIGQHFPDNDSAFSAIDSRILLRRVVSLLQENHYAVGNVDTTILAQVPKLISYIATMRHHLAADLRIELDHVSIKATTTESLGFIGREEGIAVYAVALIEQD
jgi:2-C-methyl-D-erythritol 2,4-cyclodiphosphate synthase